jgi:type VI secretion system protein ImpK
MPKHESLALLYQGVLTGIVRVQAGRQPILDAPAFRKRMKDAFLQIERDATRLTFSLDDVRQSNYAVVAFLDETVLTSKDPARANWSSLQADMFERAIAGDSVFDQISRLEQRHDSPELAELLEVHALCLLLGYQGRYGIESKGDLDATTRGILQRIARIRGEDSAFSPSGLPPAAAATAVAPVQTPASSRWWLVPVVLTPLIWTIFKVNLVSSADTIRSLVERVLVP